MTSKLPPPELQPFLKEVAHIAAKKLVKNYELRQRRLAGVIITTTPKGAQRVRLHSSIHAGTVRVDRGNHSGATGD